MKIIAKHLAIDECATRFSSQSLATNLFFTMNAHYHIILGSASVETIYRGAIVF